MLRIQRGCFVAASLEARLLWHSRCFWHGMDIVSNIALIAAGCAAACHRGNWNNIANANTPGFKADGYGSAIG